VVRKFLSKLIAGIILTPGNIRLWFREKKKIRRLRKLGF